MLCYKEQGAGSLTYSEFSLLTTFELFVKLYFFFCFPQTASDGKKITVQISAAINSVTKNQTKTNQQKSVKHNDPCATNRKIECLCDLVICLSSVCTYSAFPVPSAALQTFCPAAECDTQGQPCVTWLGTDYSSHSAIWWVPGINTADCNAQLVHSPRKGKKPQGVCL